MYCLLKYAFPLTVDPTELPEGVVENVSFDPALPKELQEDEKGDPVSPYGFKVTVKKYLKVLLLKR